MVTGPSVLSTSICNSLKPQMLILELNMLVHLLTLMLLFFSKGYLKTLKSPPTKIGKLWSWQTATSSIKKSRLSSSCVAP
jgi:hypothetical protein